MQPARAPRPDDEDVDRRIVSAIQSGLDLVPRPFAAVGRRLGLDEAEVIERVRHLTESGRVRRFGVVVRHRELGYVANAMVVWDVPDDRVRAVGRDMARIPGVRLCYRRPRRPPRWPYNLFCMIHGRERDEVQARVEWMRDQLDLRDIPCELLFSTRRFKQRGARYVEPDARSANETVTGARHG